MPYLIIRPVETGRKENTQTKNMGCEDPGIKSPSQSWACIFKLGAWTGVGFGFFGAGGGGTVWTWGGHHGLTAWSQVKHLEGELQPV